MRGTFLIHAVIFAVSGIDHGFAPILESVGIAAAGVRQKGNTLFHDVDRACLCRVHYSPGPQRAHVINGDREVDFTLLILETHFQDQQREIYFPVPVDYMRSVRTWEVMDPTQTSMIDGVEVSIALLSHPGGSYAYRFKYGGKTMIDATDGEYHRMDQESTAHYVEFFRDADLLVFDAQFSFEQVIDEKRDWGHSTPKMGAELAFRAGVKRLALTHHDPIATDESLWVAVDEAYHHIIFRNRSAQKNSDTLTQVLLARDGLTLDL